MSAQNPDKFQMRSSEFDLGTEWQLEEIEIFIKRKLTRFPQTQL